MLNIRYEGVLGVGGRVVVGVGCECYRRPRGVRAVRRGRLPVAGWRPRTRARSRRRRPPPHARLQIKPSRETMIHIEKREKNETQKMETRRVKIEKTGASGNVKTHKERTNKS